MFRAGVAPINRFQIKKAMTFRGVAYRVGDRLIFPSDVNRIEVDAGGVEIETTEIDSNVLVATRYSVRIDECEIVQIMRFVHW